MIKKVVTNPFFDPGACRKYRSQIPGLDWQVIYWSGGNEVDSYYSNLSQRDTKRSLVSLRAFVAERPGTEGGGLSPF